MIKKSIVCLLLTFVLTSCALVTKATIEQGNIITPENVHQLHLGMSEAEVKNIMGNPVLVNIFTPNRIEYIYTLQKPNQNRAQKRVTCLFQNGRLVEIL